MSSAPKRPRVASSPTRGADFYGATAAEGEAPYERGAARNFWTDYKYQISNFITVYGAWLITTKLGAWIGQLVVRGDAWSW